jgi:hypothetical protein
MLKFGTPSMVAAAGWGGERESISRVAVLISNFTAVFC